MDRHEKIRNSRIQNTQSLLAGFFEIVDEWSLDSDEQSTLIGRRELFELSDMIDCHADIILDDQAIFRLVLVARIGKLVKEIYPKSEQCSIVRTSQIWLDDKIPLDTIMSNPESGLIEVNKGLMVQKLKGL